METRGWTAVLETADAQLEMAESILERLEVGVPRGVVLPTIRFLHLFSGPEREEDLGWWLRVLADQAGYRLVVENIDACLDPSFNIYLDSFFYPLLSVIRGGAFHGVHGGSPCSTWSKARWRRPGPCYPGLTCHPL